MLNYLPNIRISCESDNIIRNHIKYVLMISIDYLLIFTKFKILILFKRVLFILMEKSLTNMELPTEKTFWELLTEENIDQDELIYGEGVIRQEHY